jgi:hypothetical protein
MKVSEVFMNENASKVCKIWNQFYRNLLEDLHGSWSSLSYRVPENKELIRHEKIAPL